MEGVAFGAKLNLMNKNNEYVQKRIAELLRLVSNKTLSYQE